jgi:molecular chaperone GrpE
MEESDKKLENQMPPENGEVSEPELTESPVAGISEFELAKLQRDFENIQKEVLYQRAEFDNTKKRMAKEQETAIKYANEKLIRELLTVVDLFERGLGHGKQVASKPGAESDTVNFYSGIEMTHRELVQLLGRFGVELIGQVGEKFDPNRHEAISQVEGPDYSEDTVAQVFQKGCLLHGRLLTPAKVAVGKAAN